MTLRIAFILGLLVPACLVLPTRLNASPALVANLPEGTKKVIAFEADDEGVAIRLEDDSLVALRDVTLDFEGLTGPSLETGYSPAHYKITRIKPDYQADPVLEGDRALYELDIAGSWNKDKFAQWSEIDLSRIWNPEDLSDPDSILLNAWWIPGRGWLAVYAFSTDFKHEQFYQITGTLSKTALDGYPHLMLFRGGRFIPPDPYRNSVKNSIIADLQNGQSPPDEERLLDTARELDPLDLSWIHYAAAWGRKDWIQSWNRIEDKKRLRIRAKTVSPPALAAMHGHADVMSELDKAGLSPANRDEFGYDACHFACIYGHNDVVEAILDLGYNPNRDAADDIYRPLSLAFDFGYDDLFGLLEERGGEIIKFNTSSRDNLLLMAASNGHPNMIRFILSKKADVNAEGENGWRPLSLAIRSGNPEAVKVLLEAGADPDTPSPGGKAVLGDAIILGEREMIALLLKHGATTQPDASASIGFVELATLVGQADIVGDLMAAGVQCSMTPQVASDILVRAISSDIPEMAILAFDACVNPDFRFYDKYPVGWVIDYYGAESTRQWWESSGYAGDDPELEFVKPSDLDSMPTPVAGGLPEYDKSLFERFGKIDTRVRIVIDESGRVYFPKFEESLPKPLRLALYESILSWRFKPPTSNGQPARAKAAIPVTFDRPQDRINVVELARVMTAPEVIEQAAPTYPNSLMNSGLSGTVEMFFVVDSSGNVRNPHVLRSPHPLLARACMKIVPFWKFKPATLNGKPVAVRVRIPMPFIGSGSRRP